MFFFPEMEPFSLTFSSQGKDSVFLVTLLEAQFFYIMLLGLVMIVDGILKLMARKWPTVQSFRQRRTVKFLYWNGTIRFLMEVYMNLTIFTLVNLASLDWKTGFPSANFSNTLAIFSIIIVTVIPIVLIVVAYRNLEKFAKDGTNLRYGTILEGTE